MTDQTLKQTPANSLPRPIVYIVDGDTSSRIELESLVAPAGWAVRAFATGEDFLASPRAMAPNCLLVDQQQRGLSGLELQRAIAERAETTVIFMSANPDLRVTVKAMKAGAFEFLVKPLKHNLVLEVIAAALEQSRATLPSAARSVALRQRYDLLSAREREVMDLVVGGRLNKQVASELGITEITMKAHRGRVMRKMQATTIVDLINMAAGLQWNVTARATRAELFTRRAGSDRYLGAIAS